VAFYAQSGNTLSDFSLRKHHLNRKGITVLTIWASANIASGAGYFVSGDREEKYFYAMNAGWGLINLAIAIPGLLSAPQPPSSKIDMLQKQTSTEKTFLVNAALDLTYITGGVLLKQIAISQTNENSKAIFAGFGNSVLLQGIGLFVFDACMARLNIKNRKNYLEPLLKNTEISFRGNSFRIKYSF
ncbi:MAG: DUF6992 family protein, partial [Bacteroidia bacterium]